MNNDSDSPQGQECEHEWVFCHDFDEDTNTERPYVECRLCGQNAGDNTGKIRIYEHRTNYIRTPEFNSVYTHTNPVRFQGTGMNVWYKAHP